MDSYELLKEHVGLSVPYATHTGVELVEVEEGVATAQMKVLPEAVCEIKNRHASAMFALGEAATGAAVASALAPAVLQMQPSSEMAEITFRKVARGNLCANARTSRAKDELMSEIEKQGKTTFDVFIEIFDETDEIVTEIKESWCVSPTRN